MKKTILLTLFLLSCFSSFTQELHTAIPLDASLKEVREILQFSDDQGKILLKFRGKKFSQYSVLQHSELLENTTVKLEDRYELLETLHGENSFHL